MPDSRIGLTILGLHLIEPGQDVDSYVGVLRVLGHLYRLSTPDPNDANFPAVAWTLVQRQPDIPDWFKLPGSDVEIPAVLEHEPPTWGSVHGQGQDTDWEVTLTKRLRGLDRAVSVPDYIRIVAEMLAVPPGTRHPAAPSPFSLPAALDYLDVVWRVSTGERSLVHLPGAEKTAALSYPAATYDELGSRLDAIGETLKSLQVPTTPGVSGHGVARLRAWLRERLGQDDQGPAELALDALTAVAHLRNAFRHPTPRVEMPDACRALNIRWPILDPSEAWSTVQDRCVEAFSLLREAIRSLEPGPVGSGEKEPS